MSKQQDEELMRELQKDPADPTRDPNIEQKIVEQMLRIRKKAKARGDWQSESQIELKIKRRRKEKLKVFCAMIASGSGEVSGSPNVMWQQWERFVGDTND